MSDQRRRRKASSKLSPLNPNEPNKELVASLADFLKKRKEKANDRKSKQQDESLAAERALSSSSEQPQAKKKRVLSPREPRNQKTEEVEVSYASFSRERPNCTAPADDGTVNSETPTVVVLGSQETPASLLSNQQAKMEITTIDVTPKAKKVRAADKKRGRVSLSPDAKARRVPRVSVPAKAMPSALSQMVDQAASQEDAQKKSLKRNLLVMRQNMENFINKLLPALKLRPPPTNLKIKIQALQRHGVVSFSFAAAMHRIRALGNDANHNQDRLPSHEIAEEKVNDYLNEQKQFKMQRKAAAATKSEKR